MMEATIIVFAVIGVSAIISVVLWWAISVTMYGYNINAIESRLKHLDSRLDRWAGYHSELCSRVDYLEEPNDQTKPRKR
jgi:hypothetical protein